MHFVGLAYADPARTHTPIYRLPLHCRYTTIARLWCVVCVLSSRRGLVTNQRHGNKWNPKNKNNNTFNYRSSGERRVVKWRTHTQLSLNIHLVVDAFVRGIFFFYSCLFVFLVLTYARRLCARPDTIGVSFFLVFFLFFLFRECCASNAELLLYPSTIQKRPSNSVTIIIIISIRNKICFVISLVLANNIFCCCCCCVGFLFVDFDGVARFRPKWAFWSMALNDDAASTDSLQFIFIVCA